MLGRFGQFSYKGKSGITVVLKGVGGPQFIRSNMLSGSRDVYRSGTLLSIGEGVTLVLDNVIVKGTANDKVKDADQLEWTGGGALVLVRSGGTLIMENGAAVIDGYNRTGNGGGVAVRDGGTFHMKDAVIAGSIITETLGERSRPTFGAGVFVESKGTFSKTGGIIYGIKWLPKQIYTVDKANLTTQNGGSSVRHGRGHAIYFENKDGEAVALDETVGLDVHLSFSNGQFTKKVVSAEPEPASEVASEPEVATEPEAPVDSGESEL